MKLWWISFYIASRITHDFISHQESYREIILREDLCTPNPIPISNLRSNLLNHKPHVYPKKGENNLGPASLLDGREQITSQPLHLSRQREVTSQSLHISRPVSMVQDCQRLLPVRAFQFKTLTGKNISTNLNLYKHRWATKITKRNPTNWNKISLPYCNGT